jgi:AICAR transformylase/IMP cyclohydrolase PurH
MAKTVEIERPDHTMKAAIEQMDNGALMIIRRQSSNTQQGIIVLKKVYTDFDSLVEDLRKHMQFKFE